MLETWPLCSSWKNVYYEDGGEGLTTAELVTKEKVVDNLMLEVLPVVDTF
jgi:hypothetical protein